MITAAEMAKRREEMLAAAFRLFSERNIDSVQMAEIAQETDYTLRSLQRYFRSKDNLVIAVATWAFENFLAGNRKRRRRDLTQTTAAEDYEFFLDSFFVLYRDHAELLRFNQMFNVFIRAEHIGNEQMRPYQTMLGELRERFHVVYEKRDGTLRTDVSEDEIFCTSLHLMLAAVTRFAVGLVYRGETKPERELLTLKEMLLAHYTV